MSGEATNALLISETLWIVWRCDFIWILLIPIDVTYILLLPCCLDDLLPEVMTLDKILVSEL